MKREKGRMLPLRKVLMVLGFMLAIFAVIHASSDEPLSRSEHWEKVREAIGAGLPRTAIEHLDPIIEGALEAEAYAEAVRAMGQKVALEGQIQGDRPEEKIVRFEEKIEGAPRQMQPVMKAILANWYWHYFQANRRRFMQRTATAEAPGEDITAWDLPRIFAEIDRNFSAALENDELLRQTPIEDYDALLDRGTMPDRYRPTLYDFVGADALEFYRSGEQAAARPQDAFVLSADTAVFATAEEFMRWQVETTDTGSPVYKAVLLYQDLLAFHREAGNTDALIDWDLDRLRFAYNMASGEEKNIRYRAALRRFIDRHGDHEISARARHDLASLLQDEGELVEARDIASQGEKMFPDSPGGKLCYNIIQQIENKSASISTERVWNRPTPDIEVRYRNVDKIHFRLVAWNWEKDLEASPDSHPEQFNLNKLKNVLEIEPALEWTAELPRTDDYHERTERSPAPADLEPGFYWLLASHNPEFSNVSQAPVWVSELALVMRSGTGERTLAGLVLEAESGEPVEGARVRTWALAQPWRNHPLVELDPAETGPDGMFRVEALSGRSHVLLIDREDQHISTGGRHSARTVTRPERRFERTVFFTDRSIYRPGQTIRYKGLCIDVDQFEDSYETIPNRRVTVVLRDVNGKEVERHSTRTNDHGSLSGSFTAPRDRLTGRMSIRVDGHPPGQTPVTVEEYKRPTFRVSLDPPAEAPRLNDTVSLTGTATAYTGAPTDGARVRWRVVRKVRFPGWLHLRGWWLPPVPQEEQEIAHGVTETGVDGAFNVEFIARPDPEVPGEDDPTFRYTVYADVTDAAGETRSAQGVVNVGYTALNATLSAEDWLVEDERFEVAIRTTTLDGEGQSAEGTLRIYRLRAPEKVHRARLRSPRRPGPWAADDEPQPDLSDPGAWRLGEAVTEREFSTDPAGHDTHAFELETGFYRAVLETRDRFGRAVRAELPLRVIDPDAERLTLKVPHLFDAPAWSVEPGEEFTALWGSGYDEARAYVEIEHRGKILQSYWTDPERTQVAITQEVGEEMRGGFTVRVTMVRENRAYIESRRVEVPWSNKELDISWERFVSKLGPGEQERWTAVIKGPDAEAAAAEMVATLYDKSLDTFLPHEWMSGFDVFRRDRSPVRTSFENSLQRLRLSWPVGGKTVRITYRSYPGELIGRLGVHRFLYSRGIGGVDGMVMAEAALAPAGVEANMDAAEAEAEEPEPVPNVDLDQVVARKDFNETAFFYPHLLSNEDGEVRMEFTMPEALTGWKFLGFAHDGELRAGLLTDSAVTAKDLMVQPNPPRFLREGDELEFTVRVTNQSPARQTGAVRLSFEDARTGDGLDEAMGNVETEKRFDVPSKESRTYSWRIAVPDRPGVLIYRAVGATGRLSDGEEGYLPVLSRRIMITESLPLPIRGPEVREFAFDKLLESGDSETLRSKTLTLQMVSNPSWYAVMALPYLMEHPHQSAEHTFNRLYANALARYIANSDPKIRRIFDQWKATDALDSPLEKNEELKDVVLEETPWVRQAESESQARRNVGILFDGNRLDDETGRLLHRLSEMQLDSGAWPWFPGGRPNDFITLYITTGFGRLRHLGVNIDVSPALKALSHLDNWAGERHRLILQRGNPGEYTPSPTVALYLYGRTFFLDERPIAAEHREAVDFFIQRAKDNWLEAGSRQSQAHLALALHRFGEREAARGIMRSIRERSVTDEELGRFWRDMERSWWWYRAPIETQALMIEAFDEVMGDAEAVEECRVWLLKQKQTQDWKTTKATADAIYALLLRGADMLASDEIVGVSLADTNIEPPEVEAGTGFFEKRFTGPEIEPEMGAVTVEKVDKGLAWGGLHWQYLEDIDKVTPHEETPLTLEKALYTKQHTERGPQLERVDGPVQVGDELVVRIVLRTDRDMEYVHLKDHRGSGTEPVNVLSGYRFQDGLRYYESTRDTASHFFIDYLPKGTYVFEYSVRVQHRGRYQTGVASIQCMYAPEFNSHSESFELAVE